MNQSQKINEYQQQLVNYFNHRSDNYDQGNFHPELAHRLVEVAQISPGQIILDIATATGLVAIEAAQLVR
jgi:ubiquinone/menaquinone biosynthesis C-methylase UbiE